MGQTVRLFVALELDRAVQASLEPHLEIIRRAVPAQLVRWTPLANIHLTLKFLGDVPIAHVPKLMAAFDSATQGIPTFLTKIQGVGCFPNARRPRIVWLGLDDVNGHLMRLHQAVERTIAPLGYPTEARPFNPHLTIGRVKQDGEPARLSQLGTAIQQCHIGLVANWATNIVSLMQSELNPAGAQYTALKQITLV